MTSLEKDSSKPRKYLLLKFSQSETFWFIKVSCLVETILLIGISPISLLGWKETPKLRKWQIILGTFLVFHSLFKDKPFLEEIDSHIANMSNTIWKILKSCSILVSCQVETVLLIGITPISLLSGLNFGRFEHFGLHTTLDSLRERDSVTRKWSHKLLQTHACTWWCVVTAGKR